MVSQKTLPGLPASSIITTTYKLFLFFSDFLYKIAVEGLFTYGPLLFLAGEYCIIETAMTEKQDNQFFDNAELESYISLLTAHQHRVYNYIVSRVPRKSDADDIMQETNLTMWRKFGEFKKGTDFRAWGFSIAHYCIMNFRKKNKNNCLHLSDEAIQAIDDNPKNNHHDNEERIVALKQCVKKLNKSHQQLLLMRYHQETPAKIIATRVGKSIPYVYKTLAKIHEFLLQCVHRNLGIEPAESEAI